MPTLDWIGKKAVVNHHREVPFRLLKADPAFSAGNPDAGNLLVQGDNLLALKSLLPYYAGQVKCIYIDPPYNTGNENWIYNDNSNAPEIKKWLGKTVGSESEDLSRHDKWLCMMYPRLQLLHQMLREDGAIFVSIDDNEAANLRIMMDEVFGAQNFISSLAWYKRVSPANDAKYLSTDHEHILLYAKRKEMWRPRKLERTARQLENYTNPDNDPRGPWNSTTYTCNKTAEERPNLYHGISNPTTGDAIYPKKTAVWKYDAKRHAENVADNLLYWGKDGKAKMPRMKSFLSEMGDVVPRSMLLYEDCGHTQEARMELLSIIPDAPFTTPKPSRLIERLIQMSTDKSSLILDSFAGSGTTGHAVMKLNAADGGNRRFILIEMEQQIAQSITAERLKRVLPTLNSARCEAGGGGGSGQDTPTTTKHPVPLAHTPKDQSPGIAILGQSTPGFQYCTLGSPLFDSLGQINTPVTFVDLARHVFFSETGRAPEHAPTRKSPLIGTANNSAYYLLFNGILGDKRPDAGNILTAKTLALLPPHPLGPAHPRIVFGEGSRLSPQRLERENITFKQLPYEIKTT